jgi:hypothetical protein
MIQALKNGVPYEQKNPSHKLENGSHPAILAYAKPLPLVKCQSGLGISNGPTTDGMHAVDFLNCAGE